MSRTTRNSEGVLLDYGDHSRAIETQTHQVADLTRIAMREVRILWTMAEYLDISDIGYARLLVALMRIDQALRGSQFENGRLFDLAAAVSFENSGAESARA